jgi:hypothetical protein
MMIDDNQNSATAAHERAMKAFRAKNLSFSKKGTTITIACPTNAEAENVLAWLNQIEGTYGSVDEWLDEIEVFAMRRERLPDPDNIYPWLRAAFAAGRGI